MKLWLRMDQSRRTRDRLTGHNGDGHYKAETAARILNRCFANHIPTILRITPTSSSDWVYKSISYPDAQCSCGREHRVCR